jgi:hypothetical protein
MLLSGVAAGLLWSAVASAQIPTTFLGAPNLSTITAGTSVWWQSESVPCEGNNVNGVDGIPMTSDDVPLLSTTFILDPGCTLRASDPGAAFLAYPILEVVLAGQGIPAGGLANGYAANLVSDGITATVTVPSSIWGPLKYNVDTRPATVTGTVLTTFRRRRDGNGRASAGREV